MPPLSQKQFEGLSKTLRGQYGFDQSQVNDVISSINNNRYQYNSNQSNYPSNSNMDSNIKGVAQKLGNTAGNFLKGVENIFFSSFQEQSAGMGNRIGIETAKSIVDGATGAFGQLLQGDLIGTLDSLLKTATSLGQKLATDMGTTNKQLYQVVDQSGAFVGNMAEAMRTETYGALALATSFGMSTEEFMSSIENLNKSSGRMVLYTKEALESGIRASVAFTSSSKTLLENTENFRNVGYGIEDAAKKIEEAGKRTLELGLNAKVLGDTLVKNIGKLNEYGFQNGIQGLTKMAQEAQGLNFNMENTFKIASDLFDPNKALDMSANLAMIGGAVGDFGDPLRMIYDVTNNVEGLQTSLIKAARGLATYNAEQGRFEVTGANLRRAKQMADTFGISMGELTNLAVKANVQFQAMREIKLLDVKDDQKEFLKNISTIKDGKVGFYVPEELQKSFGIKGLKDNFMTFNEFSKQDTKIQAALLDEQKKISSMSTEDIARGQYQKIDQISNILSAWYIQTQVRIRGNAMNTPLSKAMDEFAKQLSNSDPKDKAFGQQIMNSLSVTMDKLKGSSNPLHASAPTEEQIRLKSSAPNVPNNNLKTNTNTNTNTTTPTETTVNHKVDMVVRASGDATQAMTRYWSKNIHELSMIGVKTDDNPKSFDNTKKVFKRK